MICFFFPLSLTLLISFHSDYNVYCLVQREWCVSGRHREEAHRASRTLLPLSATRLLFLAFVFFFFHLFVSVFTRGPCTSYRILTAFPVTCLSCSFCNKQPSVLLTLLFRCRVHMATYTIPTGLVVVSEMPRNQMGKVNKKDLLRQFFL